MNQQIRYNGHTANPSDYDCPDGDLSLSMNAIVEEGSIRRIAKPKVVLTLSPGKKVIYIHAISVSENYIIHDTNNNTVEWVPSDNPAAAPVRITSIGPDELHSVTGIGNTLVILTSSGMRYALYKSGSYKPIQSKPVFPSLSFRLNISSTSSDVIIAEFPGFTPYKSGDLSTGLPSGQIAKPGDKGYILTKEAKESIRSKALAYINEDSARHKSEGMFQYPFMVRYAYRMYDGSLSCISSPVYMHASMNTPFAVKHESEYIHENQYKDIKIKIISIASSLMYEITNYIEVNETVREWSDLIRSIDIFVTPPLYMINEASMINCDGTHLGYAFSDATHYNFGIKCLGYTNERTAGGTRIHRYHNLIDNQASGDMFYYVDAKEIYTQDAGIKFHLVSSIDLRSIDGQENAVSIAEGTLSSLDTRELMRGDSHIAGTIIAERAYTYNARLNLTGVSIRPDAYPIESCVQFCNSEMPSTVRTYQYRSYIIIEAEKNKATVKELSNIQLLINGFNNYFFFPNVNATQLILQQTNTDTASSSYYVTQLSRHGSLNGVYGYINTSSPSSSISDIYNSNDRIPYPGKIYTSEINNPFIFPASGVNTVGSGNIINICSAAKALSEGQFGQFPLYAFTDEGVWALEVSPTGAYSAKQPITRDVCINADSITQMDNSVLFATDRGVMILSGSNSTCITEVIDNIESFKVVALPKGNVVLQTSGITEACSTIIPFCDYLRQSRMLYDYTHQRVIVYNPSQTYAYVFSLESKQWGMLESNIASGVNSYPEALAMSRANQLLNFSEEVDGEVNSLLVTRPFTLGDRDVHKTIRSIIQKGLFQRKDVSQVLYGSNDLEHWHLIRSSVDHYLRGFSGTPYKAFRLAIICKLAKHERLSGCNVDFMPRMTNKQR